MEELKALRGETAGTLFSDFSDDLTNTFSSELAILDDVAIEKLLDKSIHMMNAVVEYKELMMMYNCAMKIIRTKFDILNSEFNIRYQRNPINFINTRLKRSSSIVEKLSRLDVPFSLENIENHIYDIAGVRVICSYVDDIYVIAEALSQQDDVELVMQKDYIENPKPNGYRSLHLIVRVPVYFANKTRYMNVEVQIRTIAMDFWASLEHQMRYKHELVNEKEIAAQLRSCADVISNTDLRMLEIRRSIDENKADQTQEAILFERMKKLEITID